MKLLAVAACAAIAAACAQASEPTADNAAPRSNTSIVPNDSSDRWVCASFVHHVDMAGRDIGSAKSYIATECPKLCYKHRGGCKVWTWTKYDGGTCWFKRPGGELEAVYKELAVSGYIYSANGDGTCSGRDVVIPNCDMPGNDVRNRPGKTFNNCWGDAEAITWSDYNGGTCWDKSQASPCQYTPNKFTILNHPLILRSDVRDWIF